MKLVASIFFFLVLASAVMAQTEPCPTEGKTDNAVTKRINTLRNRAIVHGTINTDITAAEILKGGPEDTGAFKTTDYASITGYVLGADDEGPTSCNCFSEDTTKQGIVIYLGQSVVSWKDSVFVVEITPAFKRLHPEIYADGLIGQKITVTGQMMYNFDAKKLALRACKTCRATDRKTAWEICPVTDITILQKPPAPAKK